MTTPPTRVAYVTPAVGYGSTASPKTSPAFDVTTGDLLTFVASTEDSADTIGAPTASGGSVTWTLRQSIVVSSYCTMYIYTGAVGATATGITVSATGSGGGEWGFGVTVWRNHSGVGTSGKANASGAPSLALTTAANSAVVVGSDDWNAVSGSTRTWRTVNGSPITESLYTLVASHYTVYSGYAPDTGAAGTTTVGLSAPTGQAYSIAAVEILGATGSGSAFSGSVALSGSGTLTASGKATTSGSVALSGSGSLTASGGSASTGSVSLSGSGALTASGSAATSSSTSLSGSGSLTATGSPTASGTVALSGSGTLSASGSKSGGTSYNGSLALSGSGTLTASGKINAAGALALSGSGSLAGTGTSRQTGTLALSGSGTLAYSAAINAVGTIALTGEGLLTASGFNPDHLRDLSATAVLLPPRMSAELSPARLAAALEPARMTATLEAP